MECIDITKVEGCCHTCDPWVLLCAGNLLLVERSLASQEGLCFMKFVIFYGDLRTYENFDPLTL